MPYPLGSWYRITKGLRGLMMKLVLSIFIILSLQSVIAQNNTEKKIRINQFDNYNPVVVCGATSEINTKILEVIVNPKRNFSVSGLDLEINSGNGKFICITIQRR